MQSHVIGGKSPLGAPSTWYQTSPTPWRDFHSASLFSSPLFPSLWKEPHVASPVHLPGHTTGIGQIEGVVGGGEKEEIGGFFR